MYKALRSPADLPSPSTAGLSGRALRVLLVDDQVIVRAAARMVLEDIGARVREAETGEEAVTAFAEGGFDLVIMDVEMPVMDGLAAVRAIRYLEREEERFPVAILILTGNAGPGHEAASLAAGADRHLAKPIRPEVLTAAIAAIPTRASDRS